MLIGEYNRDKLREEFCEDCQCKYEDKIEQLKIELADCESRLKYYYEENKKPEKDLEHYYKIF